MHTSQEQLEDLLDHVVSLWIKKHSERSSAKTRFFGHFQRLREAKSIAHFCPKVPSLLAGSHGHKYPLFKRRQSGLAGRKKLLWPTREILPIKPPVTSFGFPTPRKKSPLVSFFVHPSFFFVRCRRRNRDFLSMDGFSSEPWCIRSFLKGQDGTTVNIEGITLASN